MTKTRRKFTAEQKAAIVRRHLKDKEPISTIAAELSIQPTQIHQWVALVVDQAERVFEKSANSERVSRKAEAKVNELKDQPIKKLEEKLIHKNEVIAELMEENVKAKKPMGTSRRRLGPPRHSRQDRRLHEVFV
jgi:transposase-like protein